MGGWSSGVGGNGMVLAGSLWRQKQPSYPESWLLWGALGTLHSPRAAEATNGTVLARRRVQANMATISIVTYPCRFHKIHDVEKIETLLQNLTTVLV